LRQVQIEVLQKLVHLKHAESKTAAQMAFVKLSLKKEFLN
jgi:hypothetical protein